MFKAAIIIDPDQPQGLLANTVACITSGLFLDAQDLVGPEIKGTDVIYIPITKIPILILKPTNSTLYDLCLKAQELELKYMAFTREGQSTTSYEEYAERVKERALKDVTLIGLGILGEEKVINSLVGSLPMLR